MPFALRDLNTLSTILHEAAAIEIMPRFRRLTEGDVRRKRSAIDLVTEADEAAERRIAAALSHAFPGALVVGEEAASADPSIVAGLAEADLAFVVDPVDGTLNYASDLPLFAVMAAALSKGEPVGAAILDPNLGDCATALRGGGAWLDDGGTGTRPLRVAAPRPTADMAGFVSWTYFDEPRRSRIPAAFPAFADVSSLRCCGQEYRLAAAGKVDFLMYGRLNPWDHAPGSLIYEEAGGCARLLSDEPYRAVGGAAGLLCAPDRDSWLAIREQFFSEAPQSR